MYILFAIVLLTKPCDKTIAFDPKKWRDDDINSKRVTQNAGYHFPFIGRDLGFKASIFNLVFHANQE